MQSENRDKQIGWLISLGVHALVIALFFFILAWQAPDPPLPEYGIELNFGLEQAGFGDQEPQVTPTPAEPEEAQPEEQQPEEVQEEVKEAPQQEEQVEDVPEEVTQDSQQEDSPVEAEPEPKPVPVPEKKVEEEKPKPKPQPKEEPVKEPVKETPKPVEKKPDAKALYPGATSQGKEKDAIGNAGSKEGTPDARALYGKSGGGGGGPSLDLAGWRWDSEPKVVDNSRENGRIVFEIKVDSNGEVIAVRTKEKTVSPAVEKLYRSEVEKLTFSPSSGNAAPAPISTGTITFIIRSK